MAPSRVTAAREVRSRLGQPEDLEWCILIRGVVGRLGSPYGYMTPSSNMAFSFASTVLAVEEYRALTQAD
jgi:hypothetical protein